MPYYTPMRYPGGKRRLVPAIARLLDANELRDIEYAEPYAGGAAVALALLMEERATHIHINDLSRPVFAFWYSVLHHNDLLCRRVHRAELTIAEWRRQRDVYAHRESAELAELGFAALFLNRTNRSGIIDGGVIGGLEQDGPWKLDARFNKDELVRRIKKIGRYRNRISAYQLDAIDFTRRVVKKLGARGFALYDPPYIENGEDLYLDEYGIEDHRHVEAAVSRVKAPWVVTYDEAALEHGLYKRFRRIIYGIGYSAQERYRAREVMFLSPGLKTPADWAVLKRLPLTPRGCRYPLYGKLAEGEMTKPSTGKRAGRGFRQPT